MKYKVLGPFEIKCNGNTVAYKPSELREFWDVVNEQCKGLSLACGCYLFATNAGTPWYVGKTCKQNFAHEVFAHHKLTYYNEVVANRNCIPTLFFIAKTTENGKFVKPSKKGYTDVDFLERLLIGAALRKNKNLFNVKESKNLKEMIVPGFINSPPGKPTIAVSKFIKVLSGNKSKFK